MSRRTICVLWTKITKKKPNYFYIKSIKKFTIVKLLKLIKLAHGFSASYTFVKEKKKSLAKVKRALLIY